jgi:hypothetical protein
VAVVGYMRLLVVVVMGPCGSGTDVLGLIKLIARCTGVGVRVVSAVSVVVTETVAERVFSASQALTLNFKSLSTFSISIGNGMPSSFGHSRSSRRVFSSICLRVTVSGSHQFVVVTVVGSWCSVVVPVIKAGVAGVSLTAALRKSLSHDGMVSIE